MEYSAKQLSSMAAPGMWMLSQVAPGIYRPGLCNFCRCVLVCPHTCVHPPFTCVHPLLVIVGRQGPVVREKERGVRE